MENWITAPLGMHSTSATRAFGSYVVTAVASPQGGSWRIDAGGIEIARHIAPLPVKSIEEAIAMATAQIKALIDALAPFSALAVEAARLQAQVIALQADAGNWRRQFDAARDALDARHAEAAHADEVIASTRALLEESKAALARQAARIEVLEAKAEADADTETIARLKAYNKQPWHPEMSVWGPWDADHEEGGQ